MISTLKALFNLDDYEIKPVEAHEGGRNLVYVCKYKDDPRYVLRVSMTGDRLEEEYLAETEFVHFLAKGGASVADVIPSVNGKTVEKIISKKEPCESGSDTSQAIYVSCFQYAKGMLISDNGYRYREGSPLSEYFYNTGKTLGKIHRLAKEYKPVSGRQDYFEKYNMEYIDSLIPDEYVGLKEAIERRLRMFGQLPQTPDVYGLVHFDFSDGNYHIDMKTGRITVFDFDNCMYCWYMFDLANLWTHGVGWYQFEEDATVRKKCMEDYFAQILRGYREETEVSEELLSKLPLFIDMVLIENIVDEFECCRRAGEDTDYEDIKDAAQCLINDIPYAGFNEAYDACGQ